MLEQNNLSGLNFKFSIERLPDVSYRTQRVKIPGLMLGSADIPTPFVRIPTPGNLNYNDLEVTFLVGEGLVDYLSIFDWMVSLGRPDEYQQFPDQYRDAFSDASVLILDSSSTPKVEVQFKDLFPNTLSDLQFDVTLEGVQYVHATATFRVGRYYFKPIE